VQIFFISPTGFMAVRNALKGIPGQRTHGWADTDNGSNQVIGVAEVWGDTELVATALENAGILLMPDHRFNGPIGKPIVDALAAHGVNASDTCCSAMEKIHAKSGFPPHKMKRYA